MMLFYHVLTLLSISFTLGACAPYYEQADAEQHFADFIKKYDKKYETREEFQLRFEIFKGNLNKLNEWNNRYKHENGGYVITQFADQEGHRSCVDLSKMSNTTKKIQLREELIRNAPDKIDYREQNLVTEVKNQGECGSCYIFSAIGNIEGMHAKQSAQLLSLSEQQALDCAAPGGCNGGFPYDIIKHLVWEGCMSETDYPYDGEQYDCMADPSKIKVKVIDGHIINTPDVETMKAALDSYGAPLSVAFFASDQFLAYVGSDVINPSDCPGPGHANQAIVLIGYNADPASGKRPHWIIKNSWGEAHGDKGYFYLDFENNCSFGTIAGTTVTATVG